MPEYRVWIIVVTGIFCSPCVTGFDIGRPHFQYVHRFNVLDNIRYVTGFDLLEHIRYATGLGLLDQIEMPLDLVGSTTSQVPPEFMMIGYNPGVTGFHLPHHKQQCSSQRLFHRIATDASWAALPQTRNGQSQTEPILLCDPATPGFPSGLSRSHSYRQFTQGKLPGQNYWNYKPRVVEIKSTSYGIVFWRWVVPREPSWHVGSLSLHVSSPCPHSGDRVRVARWEGAGGLRFFIPHPCALLPHSKDLVARSMILTR